MDITGQEQDRPIWVIGYGTLLLQASLGTSIHQKAAASKTYSPVIVEDYLRSFNIRPDHYVASHKFSDGGEEVSAMNVEVSPAHSFNGLVFSVSEAELSALDIREVCYVRKLAAIRDFETGQGLGEAYLYLGVDQWITRDPKRLMPHWRDIVWARKGAYGYGQAFGEYFDQTTYLADGKTLVVDVYKEFLGDTRDVDFPKT